MFKRFTDGARNVIVNSEATAREAGSPFVRRHHMLIALIDDAKERPDAIPARMFAEAAVDLEGFRAAVYDSMVGSEDAVAGEHEIGYSSGAKKALEVALREALSLGHNYIGCEHVLLSILRTADGPLATVIGGTNLRYGDAREFLRTYSPGPSRGRRSRAPGGRGFRGPLHPAVLRAAERAGDRPMTSGDLLVALAETKGTHFARLVANAALPDPATLAAQADKLVTDNVPDGEVEAVKVDPRTGAVTITDSVLAAKLRERFEKGDVSSDAIAEALRNLLEHD